MNGLIPGDLSIADIVIRKTTAAQQVADGLSDLILSGRVMPGQRLREAAIASELGVARNTIREAIRLLEFAGLVKVETNRGVVAISPTRESLSSLYGARLVLEASAVEHLTDEASLRNVRQAYDTFIESVATQDVGTIVRNDLEFHSAIVSLLKSPRIDHFYAQLCRELRFYLVFLSLKDSQFVQISGVRDEHKPIMEAIEARDIARAKQAVIDHVRNNEERVASLIFRHLPRDTADMEAKSGRSS
ncbi:transcriptional regulator, GntR family (plasmid) [Rhizobium leguminosarum bv. trifolii WSM2304]|uniref:Transcriptional regulator, GntR family n=1 Tax=Rhizobium leguminosarum bv. trifolii (strain WSM2304) TaxID=395492 RepID=A0ABF7QZN0_RHILW|nr:GntR family transcriptional regulator [Rhizobium leguminosarum]ACI59699.1 transcriptional regulator, GntR family [Rhizobium leguminosarum bv. trifolii WSM2304]